MESIWQFLYQIKELINPKYIIDTLLAQGGIYVYVGLFLIVFAETGLAVGFFLPGDSLLIVAGVIAAADPRLNVFLLMLALFAASVIGDSTGYFIGSRMGKTLFNRPNSFVFSPGNVDKAQRFFEKHGSKTVILARFVPIVRTFAPLVAGASKLPYSRFLPFSLLGSFLWIFGMVMAGYMFGNAVERALGIKLEDHIEKVVITVVFLSLIPMFIEYFRSRRERKHAESAKTIENLEI
jgi:membrane-associated protein